MRRSVWGTAALIGALALGAAGAGYFAARFVTPGVRGSAETGLEAARGRANALRAEAEQSFEAARPGARGGIEDVMILAERVEGGVAVRLRVEEDAGGVVWFEAGRDEVVVERGGDSVAVELGGFFETDAWRLNPGELSRRVVVRGGGDAVVLRRAGAEGARERRVEVAGGG